MPVDADVAAYLEARLKRQLPPTHRQTPEQHRAFLDTGPFPTGPQLPAVTELLIPADDGHEIHTRLYRPSMSPDLPILLFMHGGGWVCGTLDSIDGTMRHLAKASGCLIASIAYRRAPEHRFPRALNDSVAVASWLRANARGHGGDPDRFAIGGASAGANLAAALALLNRDQGLPGFNAQLLVYPCLDPDCNTQSFRDNATGYVLTTAGMRWYWQHYLGAVGTAVSAYAAPLRAPDLSDLPPALIMTAEFDPLRNDGSRYAERLAEAGNAVTFCDYLGVVHGFFNQWHLIAKGAPAIQEAGRWLAAETFRPKPL